MTARERLSSRKFLVVMLTLAMAFTLALLSKLDPEFSQIVSICIPAYLLGQSVVDWQKTKNGGGS